MMAVGDFAGGVRLWPSRVAELPRESSASRQRSLLKRLMTTGIESFDVVILIEVARVALIKHKESIGDEMGLTGEEIDRIRQVAEKILNPPSLAKK